MNDVNIAKGIVVEVEERKKKIKELEKSISTLHALIGYTSALINEAVRRDINYTLRISKHLTVTVNWKAPKIENIEWNVESVDERTKKALDELKEAKKNKRKARMVSISSTFKRFDLKSIFCFFAEKDNNHFNWNCTCGPNSCNYSDINLKI